MPSAIDTPSRASQVSKTVPSSAMPLISPPTLLQAYLTQPSPSRPSNRSPAQTRSIELNIGSLTHCHGSAVVKIGTTTIVCGVRGEILPVSEIPSYNSKSGLSSNAKTPTSSDHTTRPPPELPSLASLYNLLVPNLDLSTGCSPFHAPNSVPSIQSQSITQRIYTLLHTTSLIPTSDLEIRYTPPPDVELDLDPDDPAYIDRSQAEVKAYWTLYIDMVCLSHGGEGSVFDAAWLAMLAALKDVVLPKAWWDADEEIVLCNVDVSAGRKLNIYGLPVPLSFGIFVQHGNNRVEGEQHWVLLDQDAFEEEGCPQRGCVVVDGDGGKILRIENNGGGVLDAAMVRQVVGAAHQRSKEWSTVLERALAMARP